MAISMWRTLGWLACAAAAGLLIAALVLGTSGRAATVASVSGAAVRLAAVPGHPAAGYFTLGGTPGDALVAVSSPRAARIELHSNSTAGGIMRMARLERAVVPAGGSLVFTPGGKHLMIFGLRPGLKPGTAVPLRFRLASGTVIEANAAAILPGETMTMDHKLAGHAAH